MVSLIQEPFVFTCADDSGENMIIEVDMPGVKKDDITFRIHENSFSIKATKDDGGKYVGTYTICCPVLPEKASAKFTKGQLIVNVPYREPPEEVEVKIE